MPESFGKYELITELGQGGMADVYLAVAQGPAGFSKLQVIKKMRTRLADDPEFITAFLDEARLSAKLNHPNIVQTNEVGCIGTCYFIAMEFLDGQPLHRIWNRAREHGGIPQELFYGILVDVLAGLHSAHQLSEYDGSPLGVVHRDVSPHNILVTYEGQVKVVDFGIAKAAGRSGATTQHGIIKGKISYMAPEQATGGVVDARADVYSVGVILWEAAIGRRMWKSVDDTEVIVRLMNGEVPVSPRSIDPDVPEKIDEICRRALAPKSADRYASAAEMQKELEAYLTSTHQRASTREVGAYVTGLFVEERKAVKDSIDLGFRTLSGVAKAPQEDRLTPSEPMVALKRPSIAIQAEDVRGFTAERTAETRLARRGTKAVAAAVTGSAIVAVILFVALRGTHRADAPAAHAATTALTPAPEPASPTKEVSATPTNVVPAAVPGGSASTVGTSKVPRATTSSKNAGTPAKVKPVIQVEPTPPTKGAAGSVADELSTRK